MKRVARVERERSVQVLTFVVRLAVRIGPFVQLHVVQMVIRVRGHTVYPIVYVDFERVFKRVLRLVERFRFEHFVSACATIEARVCVQQAACRRGRVCRRAVFESKRDQRFDWRFVALEILGYYENVGHELIA